MFKTNFTINLISSPILNSDTLFGYFVLYILELNGGMGYAITLLTSITLFISMCFYIDNMVNDLASELQKIDQHLLLPWKSRLQQEREISSRYIEEIEFHKEIIGYRDYNSLEWVLKTQWNLRGWWVRNHWKSPLGFYGIFE